MTGKFAPKYGKGAVFTAQKGFSFGNGILDLKGDSLNAINCGICKTGKKFNYDIEGEVSPLTEQKLNFTCA